MPGPCRSEVEPAGSRLSQSGFAWTGLAVIFGVGAAVTALPSFRDDSIPLTALQLSVELSQDATAARDIWMDGMVSQNMSLEAGANYLATKVERALTTSVK